MASTDTRPNQREHILDVALELMSAHGAASTSMRQLAAACGVQVAAIYHYFDSKDALLAAVVAERQYGSRLADPLDIERSDSPADRLRELFLVVWQGALEEEDVWRLVLGEGIRGEDAVLPVGRELLSLVESAAEGWIREVVPEVGEPEAVARVLVGLLLGGFVRRIFLEDPSAEAAEIIGAESAGALVATVFP